jgi:DNA-binding HxlR family transcriptional regulator
MRKKTSTNFINEQQILESCSMALTISLLSGRWKPTILWHLQKDGLTYTDLKRKINGTTERMLVKQLQELEESKLIAKKPSADAPIRNVYVLTPTGHSIIPVLKQIEQWGDLYKASI